MVRFGLLCITLSAVILAGVETGTLLGWFTAPSYSRKIVVFLLVTHLGLYSFLVRRRNIHPLDFIKVYLGATVLRILFFGTFIFLVLRLDPSGAMQNAGFFLINYFLFIALEVVVLFNKINSEKPRNQG